MDKLAYYKNKGKILSLPDNFVFVFGSNVQGVHGAGAAKDALENFGARMGVGEGPCNNSYALPTRSFDATRRLKTLPLETISDSIDKLVVCAMENPNMFFVITSVGTGLAGYKEKDIASLFDYVPENCCVPESWLPYIEHEEAQDVTDSVYCP